MPFYGPEDYFKVNLLEGMFFVLTFQLLLTVFWPLNLQP